MIRTERVEDVERARLRRERERLGGAAPALDRVPRRADVEQREPAVLADREARDRVVAAVRREEEAAIRREDDARRALEGVRRALLAAGRLELPGTRAPCRDTVDLFDRAVLGPAVVDDGVVDLVRLHVEVANRVVAVRGGGFHRVHRLLHRLHRLPGLLVGHGVLLLPIPFRWMDWSW